MKLTDIAEGAFGDLISLAAAKIGSKPEDRLAVKGDQQLFSLVQKAKTYRFHLFDNRALSWWKAVFDYFRIPQDLRMELLVAARSEFYGRLDHSLFEADISKIVDILNPKTREGTARISARAAVTEKLAMAIIGYVSRAAGRISSDRRKKTTQMPKPSAGRSRAKIWKKKPDKATIVRATRLAKQVTHGNLSTKIRRIYLDQLDHMGFRIDWDPEPPILKLKR